MFKKYLAIFMVVLLFLTVLTACARRVEEEPAEPVVEEEEEQPAVEEEQPVEEEPAYVGIPADTAGEITVMLWSGDGSFLRDVGNTEFAPEELTGQNQATVHAVAREFNKLYPNIKINVFAKTGGPDDEQGNWAQHRENFRAEHGINPDLFASTDLPGDIQRGMVSDLSVFADDPIYQSFNPAIMRLMNFDGFQAGLPQYILPWGVYVNRSLAEEHNLDIPSPDWTIDDYTDFVSQADMENFFGAMDAPISFLGTGTSALSYAMLNNDGTTFVRLDSDEILSLLEYIPIWAKYAVWPQNDIGNIPAEVMDANWWWGFKFFIENRLLTLDGDPWMMADAAHPDEAHWGRAKVRDWDVFPRPSTPYKPNTVGVVLDPFAIRNYAMDDGDPEMSDEEFKKLQIAYTFAAFWLGDTRAWRARADQMFLDGEVLKTAINASFPVTTGELFDEQMEVWFTPPSHQRFADENLMPGFHKVIEIWRAGQFWDISDKSFPLFHDFEGARRHNLHEFNSMWNTDIAGARRTDPNWLDNVKARLPEWNRLSNERFVESVAALEAALGEFYGR
jgi:ABC-type glycerol-3-phosphate transport system substrate-binding protein